MDSDKPYGDQDEDRRAPSGSDPDLTEPGLAGDDADPVQPDLIRRVRKICLALPEATERPSHGSPAFFVRDKKQFVMLWPDGHHDNPFPHLWCAAPPGSQAELIAADPERFFRPPYVGGRGWIGVRLPGGDGLPRGDTSSGSDSSGGDASSGSGAEPSDVEGHPDSDGQAANAWAEIAELCEEAYRAVAPARLVALLNG